LPVTPADSSCLKSCATGFCLSHVTSADSKVTSCVAGSVVTKAVYPEAEAPGFEAKAVAFETEAVDPEAEAARQYINKSHI